MTIGQIKRMRLAHEIPQAEIAHLAGMQQARVCNAERGNIELKDAELNALYEALRSAIRERAKKIHEAMPGIFAELMA